MDKEINGLEVIFDLIRKHFYFLPVDHSKVIRQDIRPQNFGNWFFVIQLEGYRIRIDSDRGEVFLAVGPIWAHPGWEGGPWFGIETVIAYLTQYRTFIGPYQGQLRETEGQIARLAAFLLQYHDEVAKMFSDQEFQSHNQGLELAYNRVLDKYLHDDLDSE